MNFDWPRFLDAYGVEYVFEGANVSRGHVNIACPYCGDDPSHHFGIRLEDGRVRGCFRNPAHRRVSASGLVRTLARVDWEEARRILEEGTFAEAVDLNELESLLNETEKPFELSPVRFPRKEFHRLKLHGPESQVPYWNYLKHRGLPPIEATERYRLRYARRGKFSQRIIMPLSMRRRLYGWTARAIVRSNARYRTYPEDETPRHLVFNYDNANEDGRTLFVVEGPVDAMKLDFYGHHLGVRAVGLLGLQNSGPKVVLVARLAEKYERTILLLDEGNAGETLELERAFATVPRFEALEFVEAPDPGALRPKEAISYVSNFA